MPPLRRLVLAGLVLPLLAARPVGAAPPPDLFAHENLVAWCIVPFDAQKRGPEARAAMLEKLLLGQRSGTRPLSLAPSSQK